MYVGPRAEQRLFRSRPDRCRLRDGKLRLRSLEILQRRFKRPGIAWRVMASELSTLVRLLGHPQVERHGHLVDPPRCKKTRALGRAPSFSTLGTKGLPSSQLRRKEREPALHRGQVVLPSRHVSLLLLLHCSEHRKRDPVVRVRLRRSAELHPCGTASLAISRCLPSLPRPAPSRLGS